MAPPSAAAPPPPGTAVLDASSDKKLVQGLSSIAIFIISFNFLNVNLLLRSRSITA
jgi:hypothetical protein